MKKIFIFIFGIVLLTIAFAQVPSFHQFYGEIKDNEGNLIPTCIDAYIDNSPASSYKSLDGSYGISELFFVTGNEGDNIKFYVSGAFSKSFIFENEGLTELNLVLTDSEDKLCGNDIIDCDEECDGSNFNGDSCEERGFSQGSLSCSSCKIDASACSNNGGGNGGGGGGSGGGGGGGKPCISNWSCSWSNCMGGVQRYTCIDLKKCNVKAPDAKIKICDIIPDNRTIINQSLNQTGIEKEEPEKNNLLLYIILGFIAVTILVFLIIKKFLFKERAKKSVISKLKSKTNNKLF